MYTQGVNFFKYVTPMACSDRLKIPLAHGWNKENVFPNVVILKDNKGNTWPVKLEKVEDQVCFIGAGWLKFVNDNRIEPGDFLMFENDGGGGDNVFSFVLFDPVTTLGVTGLSVPVPVPDHVPSSEPSSSFLDDSVSEEAERKSTENTTEVDDDDAEVETDEYEPEEEEEPPTDLCRGNTSSGRAEKKRSTTTDIYGSEIFRSRMIPKPNNPYFVSCIKRNRPNELHVPANVVKDYRLILPEKAKIRDTQGVEWETELKKWKDGRLFYSGGFASFSRVNLVNDDDLFVCEFLYGDDGLTLYLYRA